MQTRARRIAAEAAIAALGLGLILLAGLASRTWFEHHFLPEFLHPRPGQLAALARVRIAAVAVGLALVLLVRPRVGRHAERLGPRGLAIAVGPSLVAAVLAVAPPN